MSRNVDRLWIAQHRLGENTLNILDEIKVTTLDIKGVKYHA